MFSLVFRGFNGDEMIEHFLGTLPGGQYGALFIVMAAIFILGFFLDYIEIANQPLLLVDDKDKCTEELTEHWSEKIITFIKELQLKRPHKPLNIHELLIKNC